MVIALMRPMCAALLSLALPVLDAGCGDGHPATLAGDPGSGDDAGSADADAMGNTSSSGSGSSGGSSSGSSSGGADASGDAPSDGATTTDATGPLLHPPYPVLVNNGGGMTGSVSILSIIASNDAAVSQLQSQIGTPDFHEQRNGR